MSAAQQTIRPDSFALPEIVHRPSVRATTAALVIADVAALVLSGIAGFLATYYSHRQLPLLTYWTLLPLLVAAVPGFAAFGLYGNPLGAVEELRRTSVATTTFYLGLGACSFLYHDSERYSRMAFLVSWAVTLTAVPAIRNLARRLGRRAPWWGYPVAIVGTPAFIAATVEKSRATGLYVPVFSWPVYFWSGDSPAFERCCESLGRLKPHCVLVGADSDLRVDRGVLLRLLAVSRRVIHLPETHLTSVRMTARDFGGSSALELRNRLHFPQLIATKRVLDATLAALAAIALAPVFAVIAATIKLTSTGPVFYGHLRYGKGGRRFHALKFRSMVTNGPEVLQRYLNENPDAREEWRRTHKLRRDPRVTAIGRFLRVTSLDELPQLWNVIRNDMSLVGPRPIVDEEVHRYGDVFDLYKQVPPGITGLWQVSGRNNTTYEERVQLDEYYVRNWSVWLDLHILMRTVEVVLTREGAC